MLYTFVKFVAELSQGSIKSFIESGTIMDFTTQGTVAFHRFQEHSYYIYIICVCVCVCV